MSKKRTASDKPASTKKAAENKQYVDYYFRLVPGSAHTWKCKCGKKRKKLDGTGNSNLMSHIKLEHPNYETQVNEAKPGIGQYFVQSETATTLYGWLDLIISEGYVFNSPDLFVVCIQSILLKSSIADSLGCL